MKRWITGFAAVMALCLCGITVSAAEQSAQEVLTFESFLADLSQALNDRYEKVQELNTSEKNSAAEKLTEEEKAMQAVEVEWEIMGKYDSAELTVTGSEATLAERAEYIRAEYMDGLKQQYELTGREEKDEFWMSWDEGYKKRADVLEELAHVYTEEFMGVPEEVIIEADRVTGGFISNETITAYQIQALLGVNLDGQPGKHTVCILKQKQEELGIPVNGVVNQARIDELVLKLTETGQETEIEAANQRLEESRNVLEAAIPNLPQNIALEIPVVQPENTEMELSTLQAENRETEQPESELDSEEEEVTESEMTVEEQPAGEETVESN